MNSLTDQQLLRDYAERQSEAAFAELVRRHVDLVYSAALRMVCDTHLAQDVTQGVFVALAQNAGQLANHPVLSGWLHRTARNLAANTVRSETRRRTREQEAVAMNQLNETEADWEMISLHLDNALCQLEEADRDALMLRYFERKSAREMAVILGLSEEAAQKRASRAMESLREFFTKQRVAVGSGALAVLISANAVKAAPVELSVAISAVAKTALGMGLGAKVLAAVKIGSILGSAATFLPILGSIYFNYRAKLEDRKSSPRERHLMVRFYSIQVLLSVILVCLFPEFFCGSSFAVTREMLLFAAVIVCVFSLIYSFKKYEKKRRQIQIEEGTWVESTSGPQCNSPKKNMYINLGSACGMLGFLVWDVWDSRSIFGGDPVRVALLIFYSGITICLFIQAWRSRPR